MNLLEKDYFGLVYEDKDDSRNWLDLDKRIVKFVKSEQYVIKKKKISKYNELWWHILIDIFIFSSYLSQTNRGNSVSRWSSILRIQLSYKKILHDINYVYKLETILSKNVYRALSWPMLFWDLIWFSQKLEIMIRKNMEERIWRTSNLLPIKRQN